MAKIKLNGDTSGYIEISAPAVSGNNTLELGPGTKILTNLDNTFTGVSTFSSDVYLGNDIYLTDGSSGYERVEVDQNDIRVTGKHIHSQFGVWTRSSSVDNRRNGIDGENNDLRLYSNSTEKVRITSGGHVNIGGEYSQTDSKVTIVDVSRPIAEATLNLQSSTTSGAADTGPVLRFYGHSGSEPRYHASIKGAKESGNVGSTAGYLAFNTRPSGGGAMVERLRITSDGKVAIGFNAPAVAGLSISNSSTNRGFEFDTGSGFDSTSCIRAYDRPTTAYKSLGLTGSDIKFGINDVEKVRISTSGVAINKNAAADAELEIVQSADPTIRLHDTRNAAYKADFLMAGSAPLIRNNNTSASDRTLTIQKGTTDHLIINGNGSVVTPAQPRFLARLTANTTYNPSNFGSYIDFDVEDYDIGSNFTTSGTDQGLFTAPVAGMYIFQGAAYAPGILFTQSWFTVNGSRRNASDWVPNQSGNFIQNSQILNLSAGDKVGFHPHKGGTASFTINHNVHHTYFKGCLLG